jgi:hypothetical protein
LGSTRIDPAYYIVADGDGQTTMARAEARDAVYRKDEIWTTYRPPESLGHLLAHREGRRLISVAKSAFITGC